tara:strand:- start:984 stop:1346 length:363 start_codon:yes stop_codon:yes gene_type:complete
MKSFCPHCGTLINYVGKKPNFCSSCGQSLNSMIAEKIEPAKPVIAEVEEVEDEGEISHVPNVNKLDVEISTQQAPAQTLGNVMQAYQDVEPNSLHKEAPRQSNKTTQEQFLQEWKNEAGN